jgi:hypothetical protein
MLEDIYYNYFNMIRSAIYRGLTLSAALEAAGPFLSISLKLTFPSIFIGQKNLSGQKSLSPEI